VKKLMLWILSLLVIITLGISFLGWWFSAPGYNGPSSEHFNGTTFENLSEVEAKGFFDLIKWSFSREEGEWVKLTDEDVSFAEKPSPTVGNSLAITFVNHATFLIQTNGLNILTDPVWSNRVSPLSFAGPKRMRPPGLKFEDLPKIDLILISHNHYDHLDIDTLKKLNAAYSPEFIVPLGVDLYLNREGISNTTSLDWWEASSASESITITSVPAQHFSARGLFDQNRTLWAGYVLETGYGNVYFAGDTGYGEFFKEIEEKFNPITVGLIPIGAYKPKWFMGPIHVNPEEALQAHKDLNAEISFGMHFGTFPLADDGMKEPINDFTEAMQKPENKGLNFKLLTEGDSFLLQ
jgi:L-ascorbate metabolism protein UlaG (beta-lactamase superfamily)